MELFCMALHPHLSDLAVVGEIVVGLGKVGLVQLPEIFFAPCHPRLEGDGRTVEDVAVRVHGTRNVNVFARRDADPDGLVKSALLERIFWPIVFRTVGVRTTLPREVFVAVVFEGMEFLHLGGGFLLRFGVHVISFPTGSRPIYNRDTVVSGLFIAFAAIFLFQQTVDQENIENPESRNGVGWVVC
jgi:hypothetical protein